MLILLPEETKYLLRVLKEQPEWWIKSSLIDKIEYDIKLKERMEVCDHEYHRYEGEKQCCSKCGNIAEGMGFSWTMKEPINPKDYETVGGKE